MKIKFKYPGELIMDIIIEKNIQLEHLCMKLGVTREIMKTILVGNCKLTTEQLKILHSEFPEIELSEWISLEKKRK